jgi:putative peptidoglycan lipid II flippase
MNTFTNQKIAIAATINLSSRIGLGIFGLLQLVLIAKAFGIGTATDAYMIAIWIPLLVWGIGDSVLIYSLVPYLISLYENYGKQHAGETANHIFSWFFLSFLLLASLLYLISPYLSYILAPGFSEDVRVLTADLLRWLSPTIFLGGLTAFFSALLYTIKRFSVPALVALFPDLGAISFILFGIEKWGIKAVVLGFLTGVSIQLVVLFLTLLKLGILPRFRWSGIAEFTKAAKLMGSRFGSLGLNRATTGVDRFFASLLGSGAISVLAYSYKLPQMIFLMFVSAFGKTLMPTLAKEVAQGNIDTVIKFIPRAIGFALFCLTPIVFLLIYYSESIVRIIYQRGAFTPEAIPLAAQILVFPSIAILFQSVGLIFLGIFFAYGDTWTPFKITCLSFLLNALLDFILMNIFGIFGIAIATTVVALVSMLILYYKLTSRIGRIEISLAFKSFIKIAVATGVMGITICGLTLTFAKYISYGNLAGQLFEIGIYSLFSWIVFLIVCRLLKLEEYLTIKLMLSRKFE